MRCDAILFDFDGVIVDSMSVRDEGFERIARPFGEHITQKLLEYHRYNAGLSRYVKIRYLYEELLGRSISEAEVDSIAREFSHMMRERLTDPGIIIAETYRFIQRIHEEKIPMHIVSGSDGDELRYLCRELGLAEYFRTIEGSPTPKTDLVTDIVSRFSYDPNRTVLVGDSINDYDAAKDNGLLFIGYNNDSLRKTSDIYAESLEKELCDRVFD